MGNGRRRPGLHRQGPRRRPRSPRAPGHRLRDLRRRTGRRRAGRRDRHRRPVRAVTGRPHRPPSPAPSLPPSSWRYCCSPPPPDAPAPTASDAGLGTGGYTVQDLTDHRYKSNRLSARHRRLRVAGRPGRRWQWRLVDEAPGDAGSSEVTPLAPVSAEPRGPVDRQIPLKTRSQPVGGSGRPAAGPARNHAVVVVSRLRLPTARALAYARATRSDSLTALTVDVDDPDARQLQEDWRRRQLLVPLTVLEPRYREITRPILRYVRDLRRAGPRDVVTVFIPEYVLGATGYTPRCGRGGGRAGRTDRGRRQQGPDRCRSRRTALSPTQSGTCRENAVRKLQGSVRAV